MKKEWMRDERWNGVVLEGALYGVAYLKLATFDAL